MNDDGYLSLDEFISFLEIEVEDHKQMKEALEAFKGADTNGDEKISKEEFIQSMRKLYDKYHFRVLFTSAISRKNFDATKLELIKVSLNS